MTPPLTTVRLTDALNGRLIVKEHTRISAKSRFGDDFWDFTDSALVRLSTVRDARLRIDWAKYCTPREDDAYDDHRGALITRQMVEELKMFAFLYLSLPTAFGLRGVQSVKPQTLVPTLRALILLFSDVLRQYQIAGLPNASHGGPIRSLSDVSLQDIRSVLRDFPRANGTVLSKGLKLLCSPVMATYLPALQWNTQDIKTLKFKLSEKRTDYKRVMPNELFRLLSNSACADVRGFLNFIGTKPHDQSVPAPSNSPLGVEISDGSQFFADYLAIRETDREYTNRAGKKSNTGSQSLRKKFTRTYGVTPGETFQWLSRVQRAAFTIIGLYTGARYSDLTTFTKDCVQTIHGLHVLGGTHVKHQDLDAEEGVDLWPAIPIMRDAVACLEQISLVTCNPYLVSGTETVRIGDTPRALTDAGFTGAVNSYLKDIDTSGRWADWSLNPHQFRHTLAHQLARADVGLIFIAHQMKHLYTALHALPPDVTIMYGNIGNLATQRALHSESAYLEAAKELYSPDRPVAGGGASAFLERRKAYFEGMAAHGWTVDEVIENLAKQGLPFASVGIGYCGGRRDTLLKDGTKELPPCIGSLQCNPGVCKQAVITRTHAPAWSKIIEQNRKLADDPRMAHAKEPLLAAMEAAEQVLATLSGKRPKEQS